MEGELTKEFEFRLPSRGVFNGSDNREDTIEGMYYYTDPDTGLFVGVAIPKLVGESAFATLPNGKIVDVGRVEVKFNETKYEKYKETLPLEKQYIAHALKNTFFELKRPERS